MKRKMLIYLVAFVIFLLVFSFYGFWTATHPPRYITGLGPKDLGWEFEDITLTTKDDIRLSAWFVPAQIKSEAVIIVLHGYPADKANTLHWSSFLHHDFNLLFLDFRYFGSSAGSLTTIGYNEQNDLLAAINYLKEKQYGKIGVLGFSLGGAVAILAASKTTDIKAIVSDSSFADINLMGHEFYGNFFILKYPLTHLSKLWARILLGINADEIAPQKTAVNLKIPILLIHSQKDQTIPFNNALRLQKALVSNKAAQFLFFDQGAHGAIPENIKPLYQQKVLEFFRGNL